ncbi:MAG: metallophosphoesterase, partial [Deltaproteobacteria bacterium]|nr:metallophosphoesterase [Deltaproteobacteria bacterium]
VLAAAEGGGAEVLVNGSRLIGDHGGQFALVGIDDVWTGRNGFDGGPDLDRALLTVPEDMPRVLLCHNPVFFPEAAGRVDLQLSGHTHGGQVNLVVNPAEVVLPYGYVAGLYERGGSTLYVNRGFGTAGPPSRVGSPPEITKVILTAA